LYLQEIERVSKAIYVHSNWYHPAPCAHIRLWEL
jgi:hypothetical protein